MVEWALVLTYDAMVAAHPLIARQWLVHERRRGRMQGVRRAVHVLHRHLALRELSVTDVLRAVATSLGRRVRAPL